MTREFKPVKTDEFLCRCGGPTEKNVVRCNDVVAEARRVMVEEDWRFDPDDWLSFQRALLCAICERASVKVHGDQWFAVALMLYNVETHESDQIAYIQCDDPFDGFCGAFLVLRSVLHDA